MIIGCQENTVFIILGKILTMKRNKKPLIILGMIVFVIIGMAATDPPKGVHKNLKILPKDISHEDLDKVMDQFKDALGVKCNFCHAKQKDDQTKWDFPSDEKPEKNIARKMMTMMGKINKKYFHYKVTYTPNEMMAVGCKTCHHGNPRPEDALQNK